MANVSKDNEVSTIKDISPKQDGGVLKKVKVAGKGDKRPGFGDKVKVHYVGTLEDGSVFDSSRERDELFEFDLGKGSVIKAWDIGVATMEIGEICTLTCKSEYAYGSEGSLPKIGPNATLIFEIELFSWEGEDISENRDGSIRKSIIKAGDEFVSPKKFTKITVEYTETIDDVTSELKYVPFILGEGSEHEIPHGLELAIMKMVKGEEANITIKLPNAQIDMSYNIKLKCIEKVKDTFDMVLADKVERGGQMKDRANKFFKISKYVLACDYYTYIVSMCKEEASNSIESPDHVAQLESIIISCQLNASMCQLKFECFAECIDLCTAVLEKREDNVKALYRRGLAYKSVSSFSKSIADFKRCLKEDPDNSAATNQLVSTVKLQHDQITAEKSLYSNMFKKMSAEAEEEKDTKDTEDTKVVSDGNTNKDA